MIAESSHIANLPLLTVQLLTEDDIVVARQRGRQIAALAGFGNQDQVRVATAVSEMARNAIQHGAGGQAEFSLLLGGRAQTLSIAISDRGPGIGDLDRLAFVAPQRFGIGISGTRRLMDGFEIDSAPGKGTTVRMRKHLPPGIPPIDPTRVGAMMAALTSHSPAIASEARIQGMELLEALESLRAREAELERRNLEMRRVNAELEETNRGVVALYAELDEKAAALRSADDLKGRFLRHVSHEFRSPLNSILAISQLLLRRTDGELTSEQERQVGYIRKAAQDLVEMVNDLLDLAKVESGKTEVHNCRINLSQLLGAMRGVMRPLVANDGVSLVFEEAGAEFWFESDESKLAQILRNLISNALKFTEKGEVRISAKVSGGTLAISVSDTGIGIAPQDLERIFEEFSQVQNPIQGKVKGTGLGLPLSRKLAQLLNGELTVESRLGEGSTFTLKLPVDPQQSLETTEAHSEQPAILVIDDDEQARRWLRQRLRGTRHRWAEARDGLEGAELARFEAPALIVLDLMMPGRDGFELLRDLKNDPSTSGIPVLIHTSRRLTASDMERLGGREAGILPKDERWPEETLRLLRTLLMEPDLFGSEPAAGTERQ